MPMRVIPARENTRFTMNPFDKIVWLFMVKIHLLFFEDGDEDDTCLHNHNEFLLYSKLKK